MAVAQFSEQFLANLQTNGTTVKEFYDILKRTPAVDRIKFLCKTIDEQKDLPKFNWSNDKDDEKSEQFRKDGNERFVQLEFVEALVGAFGFRKQNTH